MSDYTSKSASNKSQPKIAKSLYAQIQAGLTQLMSLCLESRDAVIRGVYKHGKSQFTLQDMADIMTKEGYPMSRENIRQIVNGR